MTLNWTRELVDIINDADRDASKMSVRLNSALILRSMLKSSGQVRSILESLGFSLQSFETGLRQFDFHPEPLDTPQRLYDRSARLAACAREDEVHSVHVLMSMLDESCLASALLRSLGFDLDHIRALIYGYAEPVQMVQGMNHGQRASSQSSMSAVVVQRKAPTLLPHQFIDPQPAASFGAELGTASEIAQSFSSLGKIRDGERAKGRPGLMTLDEIARLSEPKKQGPSPSQPSLPFIAKRLEFEAKPSPKAKKEKTLHATQKSAAPKLPSARESQQSTAIDLARRLQQKKSQTNEAQRSSADLPQAPAPKPQTEAPVSKHAPSRALEPQLSALDVRQQAPSVTQELETPRASSPQLSPIISKKTPQELRRSLQSQNPSNSVIARPKAGHNTRRPPAGFNPLALNPAKFPTLCRFGRNLLAEAKSGRIDALIGREHEIEQLVDILNKRRSNNPILVGEAGVGKTAIIEGLALKIMQDQAPVGLENHTIVALDYGAILCGTQLRGAVQDRINSIKAELRSANGYIILFLDEIHNWLASSSNDTNADASQELKTALARGELMCIGASTPAQLRRAFDVDPAFERRFDFIEVKAPNPQTSIDIIKRGIIKQYANHHGVDYTQEAITSAVKLSDRYIQERALPDKALSVLDRAGSLCVRSGQSMVTIGHVAGVIAQIAEIPVERLLMTEKQKLMNMEQILAKSLIGHENNIARISQVIRRNHAGFGAHRPIGSFLFLGPTGVGKTEAAKVLADFLFGSKKSMVRFDMSEFMEQHSVAKLIGAPAGYVGFDDGGLLTEALRKKPYQIVLFDEIEKAHIDVMNILLQILDEGRLTDAKGRHVSFSNTVIIMTSNLGASDVIQANRKSIGFAGNTEKVSGEEAEQIIIKAAKSRFTPELYNRIEEKLVFHPLSIEQIERIAVLLLEDTKARLFEEKQISLVFDNKSILPLLLENGGFDPNYGARPMRKTIQSLIESRIAEWILGADTLPQSLAVSVVDDVVCIEEICDFNDNKTQ